MSKTRPIKPPPAPAPESGGAAERLGEWALACALLGAALLLDPFAEAGFDAPKRLAVLLAAGAAAAVLVWNGSLPQWRRWPRPARWSAACAALGVIGLVVSACASPHQERAWDALRGMLLLALLVPAGASALLAGRRGERVLAIALLASALNALLSLLQAAGLKLPLGIARLGGRLPTGALLGNEGYVALACALMAAACCAIALNTSNRRLRFYALGGAALGSAAIAVNLQLTAAVALAVAAAVLAAIRWRLRRAVPLALALLLAALAAALVPAVRDLTWAALPVGGAEGYQRLTTYRLSAWVAADQMVRTRPLTGYGPGSFAAEAQTQRLAAEIRLREHLPPAINAGGFVHAHQEYLQLAAEAGVPTLLALVAAFGVLITSLFGRARSPGAVEPLLLLAVLVAGATAALAWFPLHIPFTAVALLLACGRAWRLIAQPEGTTP